MQGETKQELNIVFNANTADYAEVVDSIYDGLRAAAIIEKELSDGFQVSDLFAAIPLHPIIMELINDAPVFLVEFKKLSPDNAMAAVESAEIKIKNGQKLGSITTFIVNILKNSARSAIFAEMVYKGAKIEIENWKSLIPTKTA